MIPSLLQPVLDAIATLAGTVAAGYVVRLAGIALTHIKNATARAIIADRVAAIEQIGKGLSGEQKRKNVEAFVRAHLPWLPAELLVTFLEAAVASLPGHPAAPASAPPSTVVVAPAVSRGAPATTTVLPPLTAPPEP